ncbi:amidohydrolase family protein [Candidatus Thorarchaeota archaeon]|nr:MAG: amidohydrolase family protein [Candidatus Thorarchaeota archaeon]
MDTLLLKTGKLIVGDGRLEEDTEVLVKDGRIAEVGEDLKRPSRCETFDFSNRVVMPGIVDAHLHVCYDGVTLDPAAVRALDDEFMAIRGARLVEGLLDFGITTVADAGARGKVSFAVKQAAEGGVIRGPRVLVSGRMITITGGRDPGSGALEADGVDAVKRAVREEIARGVDFIKLAGTGAISSEHTESMTTQFDEDELRAATEEAHKVDRPTHSHAYGDAGIRNTIMAGVDVLVHGHPLNDENLKLMKKMGTIYMPTIVTFYESVLHHDEGKLPEHMVRKEKEVFPLIKRGVENAVKAGVEIAVGTDTGLPYTLYGNAAAEEMELLVNFGGMSEMDAIVAGTRNAARSLNAESSIGTVEVGRSADIVVLQPDVDPLEDITVLKQQDSFDQVFLKGLQVHNR